VPILLWTGRGEADVRDGWPLADPGFCNRREVASRRLAGLATGSPERQATASLLPAEGWSRGIRSGSKHATRRWHGRAMGTYPVCA